MLDVAVDDELVEVVVLLVVVDVSVKDLVRVSPDNFFQFFWHWVGLWD